MLRKLESKNIALLIGLLVVYFAAGKLGLRLASVNASTSAVWPCTGIAIAALLILGLRAWPAIFAGAFFVNITTAGTILTSLAIATGNTLEAAAAAYLVMRFAGGRNAFQRSQNIFRFALFAAILATAISATIGSTTLILSRLATWPLFTSIWSTWWLGD